MSYHMWKSDMPVKLILEPGSGVYFTDGHHDDDDSEGSEEGEYVMWITDEFQEADGESAVFAAIQAALLYATQRELFLEINLTHYLNSLGITRKDFPHTNQSRIRVGERFGTIAYLQSYHRGDYKYWIDFDDGDNLELVEHSKLVMVAPNR